MIPNSSYDVIKSCSCHLFLFFLNFQVLFKWCSYCFPQVVWSCDLRVHVACSFYFLLFFCSLCAHQIRIFIWCLLILAMWSRAFRVQMMPTHFAHLHNWVPVGIDHCHNLCPNNIQLQAHDLTMSETLTSAMSHPFHSINPSIHLVSCSVLNLTTSTCILWYTWFLSGLKLLTCDLLWLHVSPTCNSPNSPTQNHSHVLSVFIPISFHFSLVVLTINMMRKPGWFPHHKLPPIYLCLSIPLLHPTEHLWSSQTSTLSAASSNPRKGGIGPRGKESITNLK